MGGSKSMDETYKPTIDKVLRVLEENNWASQFNDYVTAYEDKKKVVESAFRRFRYPKSLDVYLSTDRVRKAKDDDVEFDLRYEGQSVAKLKVKEEALYLIPETENNKNHYEGYAALFKHEQPKESLAWNSTEAQEFRKYFAKSPERIDKKSTKESQLESRWLKQFKKRSSTDKLILNIRPIQLFNGYFQMPTPLAASDVDNIKYAEVGGGIDILARQGVAGRPFLTVIELKNENKVRERPEVAIKQAIAYATFMQRLLRTEEAGNTKWWKFFGFGRPIDNPLTIRTVIAMPSGKYNDDWFAGKTIGIPGSNDVLELHYLYFDVDEQDGKLSNVKTSLPNN